MHHYRRRLRRARRASRLMDALLSCVLLASFAWATWPLVQDLASSAKSQAVISRMSSSTDRTEDGTRTDLLREAQAYNLSLGGPEAQVANEGMHGGNEGADDVLSLAKAADEPTLSYEQQLCWLGSAALAWLEVPEADVAEPVYHGTSEEVLAQGIGHLEGTSLPVGGTSSHCVLAAHSGMAQAHMFDDLEQLEKGDIFVLHTLGDAYWYEVCQTEVVTPREADEHCDIIAGEDLCTLVTCTPYGVNSHRLLVHGRRTAAQTQRSGDMHIVRHLVNRRTMPVVSLGALGLLLVGTEIVRRMGKRKR